MITLINYHSENVCGLGGGDNYFNDSNFVLTQQDNIYVYNSINKIILSEGSYSILNKIGNNINYLNINVRAYNSTGGNVYYPFVVKENDKFIDEPGGIFTINEEIVYVDIEIRFKFSNSYNVSNLDISNYFIMLKGYYRNIEETVDFDEAYIGGVELVALSELNVETNVNNPVSLETVISFIKVVDDYDGCIYSFVVMNDLYSDNKFTIGSYVVTLKATDESNNEGFLTLNMIVKDYDAPIISGEDYYEVNPNYLIDVNDILNNLTVIDNYDDNLTIHLYEDLYTTNYNVFGLYEISFISIDSSNNIGVFNVSILVVDRVAPEFVGNLTQVIGNNIHYPLDVVLSYINAFDDVDGDLTSLIKVKKDLYSTNLNRVGSYTIELSVSDYSGNEKVEVVLIIVKDATPPVFYVDISSIRIESNGSSIVYYLEYLKQNGTFNNDSLIEILSDDYTKNVDSKGEYLVTINCDGDLIVLQLIVNSNSTTNTSFFGRILNFFKNIWVWIRNLFIKN